jgi:hypothetical protein
MPYAWETKPSAEARRTGYRRDSAAHQRARMKVPAKRRRQIAKLGGTATAKVIAKKWRGQVR